MNSCIDTFVMVTVLRREAVSDCVLIYSPDCPGFADLQNGHICLWWYGVKIRQSTKAIPCNGFKCAHDVWCRKSCCYHWGYHIAAVCNSDLWTGTAVVLQDVMENTSFFLLNKKQKDKENQYTRLENHCISCCLNQRPFYMLVSFNDACKMVRQGHMQGACLFFYFRAN
jgi:hypothetical protein